MKRLTLGIVCLLALGAPAMAQEGGARREEPPPPQKAPQLTRNPELLESAVPDYPPEAAAAGLTAEVPIDIHVDATGTVTAVDVTTPQGHGFDEAAVAAAMKYKFRPAEVDGQPAPITVSTVIHFVLQPPAPALVDEGPVRRAPAGTSRAHGLVKERGTRTALAGAAILLERADGASATTESDETGAFSLEEPIASGTYQVTVVLSGYERLYTDVTIGENEDIGLTLYLLPQGGNPYETTVEAERDKLEVTRHTIDRRVMTSVPGTFGDPLRVIQNLPGISRAPYGLGVLLVRGSGPDDSGVYIDGHKVPILYHFLGGPSILNPEFLDQIDFYPGGFPVRFGRNTGGILDVSTREGKHDGVHGAADIDLIDSSVYARVPLGDRVTLSVAGRRSYIDAVLALLPIDATVAPVYWDYQARVDVDLPGADALSFMFFGSDDTLRVVTSGEDSVSFGAHIGFHRLRATYVTPLSKSFTFSLSPAFGIDQTRFDVGDFANFAVTQTVAELRERVVGKIGQHVHLDLGTDLEYRINGYDLKLPFSVDTPDVTGAANGDPAVIHRDIDSLGIGSWLELALELPGGLKLIPGVRADVYFLAGEPRFSLDPRFVTRWELTPRTALKGYVGLFHQAPTAEAFDPQFGNPGLDLEQAWQYGLGAEQKLSKVLSLEGEVYYVDRSHQATFTDAYKVGSDGTIIPLGFDSVGTSRSYGLEVLLRHEVTRHFFGWVSYTLSRSLQRRRPDQPETPTSFDSAHNLIAVASWRVGFGLELGLRFRLVSGQPDTPVLGGTLDTDAGAYLPFNAERNSGRKPTFSQLDVRAEKTWIFQTWSLSAYLDVQNVYNATNPEATVFDYRYRKSGAIRGLPILPTLGVKGTW
jgi:TonB family protein